MTRRLLAVAALLGAAAAHAEVAVPLALEKGIPVAQLTINGADGIVGADFFQAYAVYVDLANGKVALRPTGK